MEALTKMWSGLSGSGAEALGPEIVVALTLAALATSALSAIVGMAGGITLLAVMLLFQEPLVAIPLHGIVQLVSNGSRTYVQRAHLRTDLILRYALPLLPAAWLGLFLARGIDPVLLKTTIGLFVLLATWRPKWLLVGTHPERSDPRRRFFVLGAVAGCLNVIVGATGPLIAPFFLNLGLTRFSVIGTKAACQALGHVSKVVVFGLGGFAFAAYAPLLILLGVAVVVGTWLGSLALEHVNEVWFTRIYRGVLTVVAIRLAATPFLAG